MISVIAAALRHVDEPADNDSWSPLGCMERGGRCRSCAGGICVAGKRSPLFPQADEINEVPDLV
jgi:hypothetical protein